MADSKPKKAASNKKIVDVKHDGDGATGNSKSIIVNNRPILKDPMMAEVSKLTGGGSNNDSEASADKPKDSEEVPADDSKKAPAKSPAASKTKIQPLSDDAKSENNSDADEGAATNEAQPENTADTSDDVKTAPEVKQQDGKDKPTEPEQSEEKVSVKVNVAPPKSDTPEKPDEQAAETSAKDEPASTSPAPDVADEKDQSQDDAEADTSGEEANSDESTDESPAQQPNTALPGDTVGDDPSSMQPGRSFDDAPGHMDSSKQPQAPSDDGVDDKKPEKPDYAKLTPEQEKSVESGEFFLPIKTAEGKRLRREIIIAILIVLLLIVVWVDVMLDAGLISIGGIDAPTNFFK